MIFTLGGGTISRPHSVMFPSTRLSTSSATVCRIHCSLAFAFALTRSTSVCLRRTLSGRISKTSAKLLGRYTRTFSNPTCHLSRYLLDHLYLIIEAIDDYDITG